LQPLSNYKSAIETLECPEHKQHPVIILDDDNDIKIVCCCPDFKVRCFQILKKLMDGQSTGGTAANESEGS